MQFSVAELPLALFTTLAPLGAGAFVALACAFFTTSFSDEQQKKIDRGTIIPLAIVIIGFICAFFHLASPMNAPSVFLGAGSPMCCRLLKMSPSRPSENVTPSQLLLPILSSSS